MFLKLYLSGFELPILNIHSFEQQLPKFEHLSLISIERQFLFTAIGYTPVNAPKTWLSGSLDTDDLLLDSYKRP